MHRVLCEGLGLHLQGEGSAQNKGVAKLVFCPVEIQAVLCTGITLCIINFFSSSDHVMMSGVEKMGCDLQCQGSV